jgi:hypothetical protein
MIRGAGIRFAWRPLLELEFRPGASGLALEPDPAELVDGLPPATGAWPAPLDAPETGCEPLPDDPAPACPAPADTCTDELVTWLTADDAVPVLPEAAD